MRSRVLEHLLSSSIIFRTQKSLKRARQVTSEFHRIQRKLDNAGNCSADGFERHSKVHPGRDELKRRLNQIGGRQAYQEASVLTTTRHRPCKWVFSVLTKQGLRPKRSQPALRLLEVGAVNTQFLSVPWLDVRAIDIKSQHPRIEQIDFFSMEPESSYDAVVLSMVLNCVPSPRKRGQMLALVRKHLLPGGQLFLMIPRRCIEASRFCTSGVLIEALSLLCMRVVETKLSPKIAFFCAEKMAPQRAVDSALRLSDPPKPLKGRAGYPDPFAISFSPHDLII